MTYQPVIPSGGNLGWSFLQRTQADQKDAFDNSSTMMRETQYFLDRIGDISSAEDLVSDRRLLTVALGAFGLDEDINNNFFIRKVLQEGTADDAAFANRLSDKRYYELSDAFAFHLTPPNTTLSDFGDSIVDAYRNRQFEVAVGEQNSDLRLALGLQREMEAFAERGLSEEAAWFTVMGNPPLRRVFEKALALPSQLAVIDIDQQVREFSDKSRRVFGTSDPNDFVDPEKREDLIQKFLFRAELEATKAASSRGTVALSLLQSLAP